MRSHSLELAGGFAAYLASKGVASWDDWGQGDEYTTATEWPCFIGTDLPPSPDRAILIAPGTETRIRATLTNVVTIRLRGLADATPDDVAHQAQRIIDAFYPNGFPLVHTALGLIRVGIVNPISDTPLRPDGERRHGHLLNFRTRSRRPRAE